MFTSPWTVVSIVVVVFASADKLFCPQQYVFRNLDLETDIFKSSPLRFLVTDEEASAVGVIVISSRRADRHRMCWPVRRCNMSREEEFVVASGVQVHVQRCNATHVCVYRKLDSEWVRGESLASDAVRLIRVNGDEIFAVKNGTITSSNGQEWNLPVDEATVQDFLVVDGQHLLVLDDSNKLYLDGECVAEGDVHGQIIFALAPSDNISTKPPLPDKEQHVLSVLIGLSLAFLFGYATYFIVHRF